MQAGRRCSLYPKEMIINGQAADQRKELLTCRARSLPSDKKCTFSLDSLVCSQVLSGFNEGEKGCLRDKSEMSLAPS